MSDKPPCFTVGRVGSKVSMAWELVVSARGRSSDQEKYIDETSESVDNLLEEAKPNMPCNGYIDMEKLNYALADLKSEIMFGDDSDEYYSKVAILGNKILEISDTEGDEWDYKFVKSKDEIDRFKK